MGIQIAVLICSLGIALLSIEWKAWKTHKLRNGSLSVFFLFALILGIREIKDHKEKDDQEKKDSIILNRNIDSITGQLLLSRKDIKTVEDTLNNVLNILEHNKISFNFRSNNIFIGAGFYKMHPDPELKDKIAAIKNSVQQSTPKQTTPQKPKVDDSHRKIDLSMYRKRFDEDKTQYVVDSGRREKFNIKDPVYKQITGYMDGEKRNMRQDLDSIKKYEK